MYTPSYHFMSNYIYTYICISFYIRSAIIPWNIPENFFNIPNGAIIPELSAFSGQTGVSPPTICGTNTGYHSKYNQKRWEFRKENKKVRKKGRKQALDQENDQENDQEKRKF